MTNVILNNIFLPMFSTVEQNWKPKVFKLSKRTWRACKFLGLVSLFFSVIIFVLCFSFHAFSA